MTDDAVRLVSRGDDAGLAESVNRAVRECFREGVLRNVSVMPPAPALDHAADLLGDLDGLCVGLHVTLASEWDDPSWGPVLPAEEVPTLVDDDGEFYPSPEALFEADPDRAEVRAEMEAQVDALREAGVEVSYADGHMLPEVHSDWFGEELAAFCEAEGLVDGTRAAPLLPGHGFEVDPDWLLERLDAVDPGTYLAVGHPGYDDEELREVHGGGRERGEVGRTRATQRRLFTDERVIERVRDGAVEVLRYDEVGE